MMRFAVVVLAGLLAAGCSSSEPEPVPGENGAAIEIVNETEAPLPPPAEDNIAENMTNAADNAVEPPAEAPTPIDQQMQDDAAATGLTARANRDTEDATNAAE